VNIQITDKSMIIDILEFIKRYRTYGFNLKEICRMINLPLSTYFWLNKRLKQWGNIENKKRKIINPYKITEEEKEKIIAYAVMHAKYYHREMAYRMIDENIVSVGISTVYRVLREAGLICRNKIKKYFGWNHRYSNEALEPDELWQADITYLKYKNKDVYQLSFIDVYSRFVVFSVTLTNMTSSTVSDIFEKYIEKNKESLLRIPRLQTDNGSCFIGTEFKLFVEKYKFEHTTIHPGTPTENVIIERWHRTFKEILFELKEPETFEDLVEITEKACYYYNYERYHKSLNYVTPYDYYRGNPGVIFEERKRKIEKAKENRKKINIGLMDHYLLKC